MTDTTILKNSFSVYKRLLKYVKHYWKAFAIGITTTVISSAVFALLPWSLDPLLEKGFIAKDAHFIKWLPLAIMLIFLVRGAASFVSNYCMTWVGRNVVMEMRQEVFGQLLRMPAAFYDKHSSGQLLSTIIYNVEQLAKASTDALVTLVRESCLILGLITVMFVTSWKLTFLFLTIGPVVATVVRLSSKRLRQLSFSVQNAMGDVTHVAEECIEGYREVRVFGALDYETDKFKRVTIKNRQQEMKVAATNAMTVPAVQIVAATALALTVFLATSSIGNISAGAFMAMLASMISILKPMRTLTTVNTTIQRGLAAAESIFQLLDALPEQDLGKAKLTRSNGSISYRDVAFRYPETDKQILDGISFDVRPGQVIAFVGPSGAGKTTLIKLLPRLYDITGGKILINDVDINEFALKNLRKQISLVSQQVVLFNDTIANNIAYPNIDISRDRVIEAATAAHAIEFIENLPDGFDSTVGENGVLLSGGQRQRIAIARAVLKDSPILILDEATSALDTESERQVQKALDTLMKNRTTLVIAHRLSTIEKADQIIVLDKGRIVETGTHQQLLEAGGYYNNLYSLQFQDPLTPVATSGVNA